MSQAPNVPHPGGESPEALALRELIVCWDQAYAALTQGDVDRVQGLMELADEHLATARSGLRLSEDLLREAAAARARLEHGMKGGLEGMAEEIARVRRGGRALKGYAAAGRR
jgi:hypothetical protein